VVFVVMLVQKELDKIIYYLQLIRYKKN